VPIPRALRGEPDGVADRSRLDLVEPNQAGEDGETRRIGRGPSVGPKRVGRQVEDRSAPGGGLPRFQSASNNSYNVQVLLFTMRA
jgi:hypothetical protein